jgi:hypothetical protein
VKALNADAFVTYLGPRIRDLADYARLMSQLAILLPADETLDRIAGLLRVWRSGGTATTGIDMKPAALINAYYGARCTVTG